MAFVPRSMELQISQGFPSSYPLKPGGEAKLGPAVAGLGCKREGNSIAINKKTQKRCDNDHVLFFFESDLNKFDLFGGCR